MAFYISKLTAAGDQKLSKTVDAEGRIKPAASMYAGKAETVEVEGLGGLAETLGTLNEHECVTLGVWLDGMVDGKYMAGITTKKKLPATRSKYPGVDFISRTLDNFTFADNLPGFMYLDLDELKIPIEDALQIIGSVWPGFSKLGKVITAGSSSFLYNKEGEEIKGATSWHVWIPVSEGMEEMKTLGNRVFNRLLAKGHGHSIVDKVFRIHIKTLIDPAVWSPERIVFEAGMIVSPESGWNQRRPAPKVIEGEVLNILETLEAWKATETRDREKSAAEKMKLIDSATDRIAKDKADWLQNESKKLAGRLKVTNSTALNILKAKEVSILLASEEVVLDDDTKVKVADILLEPESFAEETLPDPADPYYRGTGDGYGYGKAKILLDEAGKPFVHSFAHGGIVYKLKWNYEALSDMVGEVTETRAIWLYDHLEEMVDIDNLILSKSEIAKIARKLIDKIDPEEFKGKGGVRSAVASVKRELEENSLRSVDDAILKEKGDEFEDFYMEALNNQYTIGVIGDSIRVVHVTKNAIGTSFSFFKRQTFIDRFENRRVMFFDAFGRPKDYSIAEAWLKSPGRRQFDTTVFSPFGGLDAVVDDEDGANLEFCMQSPKAGQTVLNLWTGVHVNKVAWNHLNGGPPEVLETGCNLILSHIKDVWCSGNMEYYTMILDWFADMLQNPSNPATLIPVLRSEQGAGKNIITEGVMAAALGQAAVVTSNKEDVIGRFASLADKVFVCYNEAVWGGGHQSSSILKSLADTYLRYERKGIDVQFLMNHLHIMIMSNSDWAAPVEISDRRFFYLDVSDDRIGDGDYFMSLKKEIETGGREAFLKLMMKRDLSCYNRYKLPETETVEKFDTKMNASPETKFIYQILSDLECLSDFESADKWVFQNKEGGNFPWFDKTGLFRSGFQEWLKSQDHMRYRGTLQQFYRYLAKRGLYASGKGDMPETVIFKNKRVMYNGVRKRFIVQTCDFSEMRERFQSAFNTMPEIWDDDDE